MTENLSRWPPPLTSPPANAQRFYFNAPTGTRREHPEANTNASTEHSDLDAARDTTNLPQRRPHLLRSMFAGTSFALLLLSLVPGGLFFFTPERSEVDTELLLNFRKYGLSFCRRCRRCRRYVPLLPDPSAEGYTRIHQPRCARGTDSLSSLRSLRSYPMTLRSGPLVLNFVVWMSLTPDGLRYW